MMDTTDILIVGVGGQGTLLASKVLGNLAISKGLCVKVSELHGMAQRGGSVVTHVRFGKEVLSPLVSEGEADYIVAFERLEALRYLNFLKPGGTVIVNELEILPMPVIIGAVPYPAGILPDIEAAGAKVAALDATGIAKECGDARAMNVCLLGLLSRFLDLSEDAFIRAVEMTVPERLRELNISAFKRGRAAVSQ